ncbi:hypothetical protein M409DRAFT_49105 [Zasmidium cellare ATCC 36951]|uniref:Uncharacterized protein n=1 Tax=Zasmidium cellare ATCC 36951 TaxID=1080233 RepID=A0A6A6D4B9_ZASCE|nr:uncharacterized protein M409DRAFT_49105 [Zasmidium cellare ATCC 36951]KAF2174247.1 hypothetical protein M409DRAFT_49105 [Zasmidium cellare ATCC 36951]
MDPTRNGAALQLLPQIDVEIPTGKFVHVSPLSRSSPSVHQPSVLPPSGCPPTQPDGVLESIELRPLDELQGADLNARSSLLPSHSSQPSQDGSDSLKEDQISLQPQENVVDSREPRRVGIFRLWWLEISACALSFACFGAILGILLYENNRPLSQWNFRIGSGHDIGPTAVVSFLSTLGKSSLLLVVTEAISQLKWLHFGRSPHPLVDVELVFAFPLRTHPSSLETASFRTATIYNPSHSRLETAGTSYVTAGKLDLAMQGAILRGFFDSPMEQSVQCSSGNCTFEPVKTLGVCSSCLDVTEKITTSNCSNVERDTIVRFDDGFLNTDGYLNDDCDYTVPARDGQKGVDLGAYSFEEPILSGAERGWSSTRWNSSTAEHYRAPSRILAPAVLVNMLALQTPRSASMSERLPATRVWDCVLVLCEKTFENISVDRGVNMIPDPLEKPLILRDKTFDGLSPMPGNPLGYQTWPADGDFSPEQMFSSLALSNDSEPSYWINNLDYGNMQEYLMLLLTVGWWDNATFPSSRHRAATSTGVFTTDDGTPDVGRALAESEDIPALFRWVAAHMTEIMRMGGPGLANRTEAYIHVRWGYLALPFTLTALSTIVLVLAIIMTERSNCPAWKSSSLALLFHSLADYNLNDRVPTRASDLEAIAKSMKGRLSKDEWPPAFVKQDRNAIG